jgi:hypothetical protein
MDVGDYAAYGQNTLFDFLFAMDWQVYQLGGCVSEKHGAASEWLLRW